MSGSRPALVRVAGIGVAMVVGLGVVTPGQAATPPAGTVDGTTVTTTSWDFAPVVGATDQVLAPTSCTANECDQYNLTVKVPSAKVYTANSGSLKIVYTYNGGGTNTVNVYVDGPDGANHASVGGPLTPQSGTSTEEVDVANPIPGIWKVISSSDITPTPQAAHAVATLGFTPNAAPFVEPPPTPGNPYFVNYTQPNGFVKPSATAAAPGQSQYLTGEPSVGYNPKTNNLLYQAYLTTARITFDDTRKPGVAKWVDVSTPNTNTASEDAILVTDPRTGRTQVSQLYLACSLSAFTDDDGSSWTPSNACEIPAGVDHQTIGSGPYAPGALSTLSAVYPDANYYCSQNVADAECALSVDGGLSYGQANIIYTSAQCFGLHGHIKVAPDGTAYVPNKACGNTECGLVTPASDPSCHKGVAVSTDSGTTWTVKTIPDSFVKDTGNSDPSIGIGPKGTVYYGYDQRNGHPSITVSHDQGSTWTKSIDLGTSLHIVNSQFPEVVAGDDNRAAMAFLGTSTAGNDQDPAFKGVWYLYVAMTYDGGQTWTTVNATPNDPVQRGCVQVGSACGRRNMLDFNDITVDRAGRVIAAYTDGCAGDCEINPKNTDTSRLASFVRQSCGKGLYAAGDPGINDFCVQAAATTAPVPAPTPTPALVRLPNTSSARPSPFAGIPPVMAVLFLVLAGAGSGRWRRRCVWH
ncbi:MAG: hypothetical protein ACYDGR_04865 [Candidatus Dormibacteria bacterium]